MKIKQVLQDGWEAVKPIMPRVKTWLTVIVTGLIIYFVGKYIFQNWSDLSTQEWHVEWGWLGVSVIFYALFWMQRAFAWTVFVRWNGATGKSTRGMWLWFQSSLARYIPLPIFEAGGRILSATQMGTDAKTAFWGYAAEVFASVASAGIISLLAFPVLSQNAVSLGTVLFLVIFLTLALALLTHLGCPILQKIKISVRMRFPQAVVWYSLYLVGFFMQGLSYYFIMKSIQYDSANIPLMIGASNFAWVIGLLNVLSPSGIGTRELVLFYTLQNQFTTQAVIFLGLAARLLGTFTEVGINLIGYLMIFLEKRRVKKQVEMPASTQD